MQIRPLTDADAAAIALWRYSGRDSTYEVTEVVSSERGFWSVWHDEDWNERSRKVAEALGFEHTGVVGGRDGDFDVFVRPSGQGKASGAPNS